MTTRPRILAIAFSIRPDAGSEPGAAWGVVMSLLKIADVDVLVSSREMSAYEKWQAEFNDPRLRFIEVNNRESEWLWRFSSFPKLPFIAYLRWLGTARRVGREQCQRCEYAAAIHVAYGSYWLPSPVVDFGCPSIWGPVGGATRSPFAMWRYLGWRGGISELAKYFLVRLVCLLPAVRRTWNRADFPVAETENTRQALPPAVRKKTRVMNRAALQETPHRTNIPRQAYILFSSRLEPRKAPALAIHALSYADPTVRLKFVADGIERRSLERLATKLGVRSRVDFLGWVPRDEMFRMLSESAAALFLGTREEGGCALAEAMQLGTPVIVLGVGGAELLAETNMDSSRVRIVSPSKGNQTPREIGQAMSEFVGNLHPSTDCFLDREAMEQRLHDIVHEACDSNSSQVTLSSFS